MGVRWWRLPWAGLGCSAQGAGLSGCVVSAHPMVGSGKKEKVPGRSSFHADYRSARCQVGETDHLKSGLGIEHSLLLAVRRNTAEFRRGVLPLR